MSCPDQLRNRGHSMLKLIAAFGVFCFVLILWFGGDVRMAFAQQPTPEQQRFGDIASTIAEQRNQAMNQLAQYEATVKQLQRDLAEAQKKAAACESEKKK